MNRLLALGYLPVEPDHHARAELPITSLEQTLDRHTAMHSMTRDTQLGTSATKLSLTLVLTLILGGSASAAPMPTSLDLSQLNGANGFSINGAGEIDTLGTSVSNAGDVNNDGVDDLIIGASVRTFSTGLGINESPTQITAKATIIFGG